MIWLYKCDMKLLTVLSLPPHPPPLHMSIQPNFIAMTLASRPPRLVCTICSTKGLETKYTLPYLTLLYCTVLYCTVLYCTVLYCTVLYCTVLYCTVLYCTVLYCTVLYCTVLYCTVLYCTVLYWNVECIVPIWQFRGLDTMTIWRCRSSLCSFQSVLGDKESSIDTVQPYSTVQFYIVQCIDRL